MDYGEKLKALEEHLVRHPNDYQGVISLYKIRSEAIEHERYLRSIEKRKLIAECRRKFNGEHSV